MGRLQELRAESEGEALVEALGILRGARGSPVDVKKRGTVKLRSGTVISYVVTQNGERISLELIEAEDPWEVLREFRGLMNML
jgi:hypothetical protein